VQNYLWIQKIWFPPWEDRIESGESCFETVSWWFRLLLACHIALFLCNSWQPARLWLFQVYIVPVSGSTILRQQFLACRGLSGAKCSYLLWKTIYYPPATLEIVCEIHRCWLRTISQKERFPEGYLQKCRISLIRRLIAYYIELLDVCSIQRDAHLSSRWCFRYPVCPRYTFFSLG